MNSHKPTADDFAKSTTTGNVTPIKHRLQSSRHAAPITLVRTKYESDLDTIANRSIN